MKPSRTPRLADLIRKAPAPPPPPRTIDAPPPAAAAPPDVEAEPVEAATAPGVEPRESPAEAVAPPAPAPAEVEAKRDYELLESWMSGIFAQAALGPVDALDVVDNVEAILERPGLLDALFAETFKTRSGGKFYVRKSVHVAVYALRLGRALGYDRARLGTLGAAALLHKIGFARLPEEVLLKRGKLSRSEAAAIAAHPRLGHEILTESGLGDVAEIVLQVNERVDGSGSPRGLKGAAITEDALVIGVVDVYEAMIQPRPYRDRVVPFAAVKELLQRERSRFPRRILREFISTFSVFPPFSYVRLNSKAVARVVENEPGYPLRPQVAIVVEPNGRRAAAPQTVRLREAPLLYITGPVSEEELAL